MNVMEGTIVLPGEETEERGNTLGVELIEINSCLLGDGDHCVVLMKRSKGEIL